MDVSFRCYDPREIFIEKCRAALTRKNYKFRDVLDIYFMEKQFNYSVSDFETEIKEKVKFMLELYKRYRENIELIEYPGIETLDSKEMMLLQASVPENLFDDISRIHDDLEQIRKKLL